MKLNDVNFEIDLSEFNNKFVNRLYKSPITSGLDTTAITDLVENIMLDLHDTVLESALEYNNKKPVDIGQLHDASKIKMEIRKNKIIFRAK